MASVTPKILLVIVNDWLKKQKRKKKKKESIFHSIANGKSQENEKGKYFKIDPKKNCPQIFLCEPIEYGFVYRKMEKKNPIKK